MLVLHLVYHICLLSNMLGLVKKRDRQCEGNFASCNLDGVASCKTCWMYKALLQCFAYFLIFVCTLVPLCGRTTLRHRHRFVLRKAFLKGQAGRSPSGPLVSCFLVPCDPMWCHVTATLELNHVTELIDLQLEFCWFRKRPLEVMICDV